VGSSLGTLANFGNVTFTDSRATMNSSVGTISNFPFIQVIMQNRQNVQLVNVSSLSSDGSSFTVTYLGADGTTQSMLNEVLENKIAVATRNVVLTRVLQVLEGLNDMSRY
jgi:serine protease inhibitor